ncbi:MAG: hypothetical protein IT259_07350 [Saprospiraceae bacterium]|nr:hypothetical protein [Saprospiraceae bacterium]
MKNLWINGLELAARIHVFLFLNVYGWGKIMGGQFYRKGHLPPEIAQQTLADATPFDLAWTFFGYSTAYIFFIGMTQILGAWLLLWNRTKLIGVAILIPVMANIVVVDTVFEVSGAIASAIVYLFLLLLVLYINRAQVRRALDILTEGPVPMAMRQSKWSTLGVSMAFVLLMLVVEQFLINLAR